VRPCDRQNTLRLIFLKGQLRSRKFLKAPSQKDWKKGNRKGGGAFETEFQQLSPRGGDEREGLRYAIVASRWERDTSGKGTSERKCHPRTRWGWD